MSEIRLAVHNDEEMSLAERLKKLSGKAAKGDQPARRELKKLVAENQALLSDSLDLARIAEESVISLLVNEEAEFGRMLFSGQLATMRDQLARPEAPMLEKLLAGRVVLLWASVQIADHYLAQDMTKGGKWSEFWAKQAALFDRRLMNATRSLALVQRLGNSLPLVAVSQTNIQHTDTTVISGQEKPAPLGIEERTRS